MLHKDWETIDVRAASGVVTVTLNRPERSNAITPRMNDELSTLTSHLAEEVNIRVVVLRGAGDDFCVGADAAECLPQVVESDNPAQLLERGYTWVRNLLEFAGPVLAVLHGRVAGAGISAAAAADFRIATPDTTFHPAFTSLGLIGDMGFLHSVPRIIGMTQTRNLLYLKDAVDAASALQVGLVDELIEADGLAQRTESLVRRLSRLSPMVWQETEKLLSVTMGRSIRDNLEAELEAQLRCLKSADFAAGLVRLQARLAR